MYIFLGESQELGVVFLIYIRHAISLVLYRLYYNKYIFISSKNYFCCNLKKNVELFYFCDDGFEKWRFPYTYIIFLHE